MAQSRGKEYPQATMRARWSEIAPEVQSILDRTPASVQELLDADLLRQISRHPAAIAILPLIFTTMEQLQWLELWENTTPVYQIFLSLLTSLFQLLSERDYTAFLSRMADKFPFPMVRYRSDGYPIIWNAAMAKFTGYTHGHIIQHYERERARLSDKPKEWPYIIMRLLYRGEELARVHQFLHTKSKEARGYDHVAFTLTNEKWEKATLLWTTEPDAIDGSDTRVAIPLENEHDIRTAMERVDALIGKLLVENDSELSVPGVLNRRSYEDYLRRLSIWHVRARIGFVTTSRHPKKRIHLAELARLLQKNLRHGEAVYRIGAERLAIVFIRWLHDEHAVIDHAIHEWIQRRPKKSKAWARGAVIPLEPQLLVPHLGARDQKKPVSIYRAIEATAKKHQELVRFLWKTYPSSLTSGYVTPPNLAQTMQQRGLEPPISKNRRRRPVWSGVAIATFSEDGVLEWFGFAIDGRRHDYKLEELPSTVQS